MSATAKVSFTIRRPTPVSRAESSGQDSDSNSNASSFKVPALPHHLSGGFDSTPGSPLARSANSSPRPSKRPTTSSTSSDEDDEATDELVTGFDQFGVERLHGRPKPAGPLVIAPLKNRDWREMARTRQKQRRQIYVPSSAAAQTGNDGSVGGLGTKDSINSGPVLAGLQVRKKIKLEDDNDVGNMDIDGNVPQAENQEEMKEEETEDQLALRALISSSNGTADPSIPAISIALLPALSETDAYKNDVETLPPSATLDDYARVPVDAFGAAMLRGMGWNEGTAASKTRKGLVEPYLPQARPSLLGIGAKEMQVEGESGKKGRPERRYVPVVKRERESLPTRDGDERRAGDRRSDVERNGKSGSEVSTERSERRDNGEREGASTRERDRDRERERDRDRERDRRRKEYDEYDSRRDRDSRRGDRDRESDRYRGSREGERGKSRR